MPIISKTITAKPNDLINEIVNDTSKYYRAMIILIKIINEQYCERSEILSWYTSSNTENRFRRKWENIKNYLKFFS